MKIIAAGALALIGAASLGEAQAGTSPPYISGTYYEQNGTATCPPVAPPTASSSSGGAETKTCQLLFAGPPAGKKVALNSVNCKLHAPQGYLTQAYLLVNLNGSLQRKQFLAPVILFQEAGATEYLVKNHIDDYAVTAPVRVVFDLNTAVEGYLTMDCQISGVLQPL